MQLGGEEAADTDDALQWAEGVAKRVQASKDVEEGAVTKGSALVMSSS